MNQTKILVVDDDREIVGAIKKRWNWKTIRSWQPTTGWKPWIF